jgi:hypothetical protein
MWTVTIGTGREALPRIVHKTSKVRIQSVVVEGGPTPRPQNHRPLSARSTSRLTALRDDSQV